MQRAFLGASLIGLTCAIIGVFVVLKGLSFMGAGISHAAFAGVTFGFLTHTHPTFMATTFSLLMVWIIHLLQGSSHTKPDVPISIFYTFTMALAILFVGRMEGYIPEIYNYLFGSILSITGQDLLLILALSTGILLTVFLCFKELHFISFDQEMAEASGVPTRTLVPLLLCLVALTVVASLKTVGALLVFALLIIPAATALQWAHHIRAMMAISATVGISASWGGVMLSYWLDIPSGATIVILATSLFFLSVLISPKRRER